MKFLVLFISLVFAGCSHLSGIDKYKYPEFNLLVARGALAPEKVDKACRKKGARVWDDGSLIRTDQKIGACAVPGGVKIKPIILIPEQLLICLPHELCHALEVGDEAFCAKKYPCVGEFRRGWK